MRLLAPARSPTAADGLPLPPRRLMFDVAGTDDIDWFLTFGRAAAERFRELAARSGRPLETMEKMLDFGCGCGRVLRHFAQLEGVEVHGTDISRRAIAWCRRNLPFAEFERNKLTPPTVYRDATFDFVYAVSVFTHLPEELQLIWIRELRRILRPRGLLALTTHGEQYLDQLSIDEAAEFEAGRLVVRRADAAGLNLCAAFHPRAWIETQLAQHFEIVEFVPSSASPDLPQDVYLLRLRSTDKTH